MEILEHLAFAELALMHDQTFAGWAAIEHIRRARQQLLGRQPVTPEKLESLPTADPQAV